MMNPLQIALYALFSVALLGQCTQAFNIHSKTNVVSYWGQNSVSAVGGTEGDLITYCQDDTVDAFVVAFVSKIVNGQPVLNLANHCGGTFPGTDLLNCPKIGQDIKACQARGKAVVISIGGGASNTYSIENPAAGAAFAEKIWNLFLGGHSNTRPFGDVVLDGVDLDLESGTNKGYVAFIQTLRAKFAKTSRQYYISSAPQCPYPDIATEATLNAAWFDLVQVQFYNNNCGLQSFGTNNFNFDRWNKWAKETSINKNVRVLLGVPGGPGGAHSDVIGASRLTQIIDNVRSYSSFGGVMMWDVGIAKRSGLAAVASKYLRNHSKNASTRTAPAVAPANGSCGSAGAWASSTAYTGGAKVSYAGFVYTAKWWTQGETPGSAQVWAKGASC